MLLEKNIPTQISVFGERIMSKLWSDSVNRIATKENLVTTNGDRDPYAYYN